MKFKYIIKLGRKHYKFNTVDDAMMWAKNKGYNFGETEYSKLECTGIVTLTNKHVMDY